MRRKKKKQRQDRKSPSKERRGEKQRTNQKKQEEMLRNRWEINDSKKWNKQENVWLGIRWREEKKRDAMWRDKKRRQNRERESSHVKGSYYIFISDVMQYLILTLYVIMYTTITVFQLSFRKERRDWEDGEGRWAISSVNPHTKGKSILKYCFINCVKMYNQLIWLMIYSTLIPPFLICL